MNGNQTRALTPQELQQIMSNEPVSGEDIAVDLTHQKLEGLPLPTDFEYVMFFYDPKIFGMKVIHLPTGKKFLFRRAFDQTGQTDFQIVMLNPEQRSIPGVPPK